MSRGWIVYILMFAVLGVGLWAVLRAGASLKAPAEIAGTWHVQWESASPSGGEVQGTMTVDQSGRFCSFHFGDGKGGQQRSMSLKMLEGTALGQDKPQLPVARLEGEGYQMTLHSTAVRDALKLEISGPEQYRGFAERVSRPGDRAAAGSQTPPAPVADARP